MTSLSTTIRPPIRAFMTSATSSVSKPVILCASSIPRVFLLTTPGVPIAVHSTPARSEIDFPCEPSRQTRNLIENCNAAARVRRLRQFKPDRARHIGDCSRQFRLAEINANDETTFGAQLVKHRQCDQWRHWSGRPIGPSRAARKHRQLPKLFVWKDPLIWKAQLSKSGRRAEVPRRPPAPKAAEKHEVAEFAAALFIAS